MLGLASAPVQVSTGNFSFVWLLIVFLLGIIIGMRFHR